MVANRWLFPGYHPGTHLDPQSIMQRLRRLGVNLLGGRNSALQNLVAEVPPPLVAELLGYSYQVTQLQAALFGEARLAEPVARLGRWIWIMRNQVSSVFAVDDHQSCLSRRQHTLAGQLDRELGLAVLDRL
jgi:hypothetical protein